MIFLSFVGLIFCAAVVGGAAGGLLGKISIGRFGPEHVVSGLGMLFFIWLSGLLLNYLKIQLGNNNPEITYGIIFAFAALLACYGARIGPK